jgi:hypothetical protein
MFIIWWGSKAVEDQIGTGTFLCPHCCSETPFSRRKIARYFTLYSIPIFATDTLDDFVRCGSCHSAFPPGVLALSKEQIHELARWECPQCKNKNPRREAQCVSCRYPRPFIPMPRPLENAVPAAVMDKEPKKQANRDFEY